MLASYMEQNKTLAKENKDLREKLKRLEISIESELVIEKENHQKTLLDLAKVNRLVKDLKSENQFLQNKVAMQDKELEDFRAKLDTRGGFEARLQERDLNIHPTKTGRSGNTLGSFDAKTLSMLKMVEAQKEKLEEENNALYKELQTL